MITGVPGNPPTGVGLQTYMLPHPDSSNFLGTFEEFESMRLSLNGVYRQLVGLGVPGSVFMPIHLPPDQPRLSASSFVLLYIRINAPSRAGEYGTHDAVFVKLTSTLEIFALATPMSMTTVLLSSWYNIVTAYCVTALAVELRSQARAYTVTRLAFGPAWSARTSSARPSLLLLTSLRSIQRPSRTFRDG